MNKQSSNYLKLAKKLTRKYIDHKDVKAILVTGSVGKGIADDESDVDIIIYRKTLTREKEFFKEKNEALAMGGGVIMPNSREGYSVYKFIDGCKCDFAHIPVQNIERIFRKVHKEYSTDIIEHQSINGFMNSVTIYSDAWIDKWKKKLISYPGSLAEMVVKNNMGLFHNIWEIKHQAIKRDDDILFYELMTKSLSRVINVLCGLNKIYMPGKMKGINYTINQFNIKPLNLDECIKILYQKNKAKVCDEFTKLVEETLSLVEMYMPVINTQRSKKLLYLKLKH